MKLACFSEVRHALVAWDSVCNDYGTLTLPLDTKVIN